MKDRTRAKELAKTDPIGWFEKLYQEGIDNIPWANLQPNPNLLSWWSKDTFRPAGLDALVVGCGLGDDAEQLSAWGFRVTAFDVSPTAIEKAKVRFPQSAVHYQQADLFQSQVLGQFDFVFEAYTVQALPVEFRESALLAVADKVRKNGHLLLIARGRNDDDPLGEMPWPLSRKDLSALTLKVVSFEDYVEHDTEDIPIRRFRVLYNKI